MTRLRQSTTNFTAGELSPDILARGDIAAYANGASKLRNVAIVPTGGVSRRAGLRYLTTLVGAARLVPFEFAAQSGGLAVISNGRMDIYVNGAFVITLTAPWTTAQLPNISWAQTSDMLLLLHPDVPMVQLKRTNATTYTLTQ